MFGTRGNIITSVRKDNRLQATQELILSQQWHIVSWTFVSIGSINSFEPGGTKLQPEPTLKNRPSRPQKHVSTRYYSKYIFSYQKNGIRKCFLQNGRHFVQALLYHYNDVTMSKIASQITSLTIVYSTVYSGPDQTKHQTSASLAFVRGIHRGPVNSPHKWPVTRKMFPFDDVIMSNEGRKH